MVAALLYPTILLGAALVIGSITGMFMLSVVDDKWGLGDNISKLAKDYYDASLGALLSVAWLLTLAATIYLIASPSAWLKIVGSLPMIGRPYRWLAMSELLIRLSVFNRYQPSLLKALHFTAHSFGSGALAPITETIAQRVEQGESFENAVHATIVSDSRAGIALTLIEHPSHSQARRETAADSPADSPADSLKENQSENQSEDTRSMSSSMLRASGLLDQMIEHTCARIRLIYPLFVLMIIASLIWGAWGCYLTIFQSIYNSFM